MTRVLAARGPSCEERKNEENARRPWSEVEPPPTTTSPRRPEVEPEAKLASVNDEQLMAKEALKEVRFACK